MLRSNIRSSIAKCSRSIRPSSRLYRQTIKCSINIQHHHFHHSPNAPLWESRSLRLQPQGRPNALKIQQRYYASEPEESDAVIGLLNLVVRKRDLLIEQERQGKGDVATAKAIGELDQAQKLHKEWKEIQKTAANLLSMTDPAVEPDEDLRQMAVAEAESTLQVIDELRKNIRAAIIPQEPVDNQSAIIEIRPGVGGQESCIFTAELARMYTRFCQNVELSFDGIPSGLQVEELSVTPADAHATGGTDAYKEVLLSVKGRGAYGLLRHEAGVHRVQRVPTTIAINKLQSSTIAIVVLPSADDDKSSSSKASLDDLVDPKDVKEEVMRSRGAGGQHVNKTESAIRLTHEPTGITVSMQDSRSQHQNRTKAWEILRARLLDRKMREEQSQVRDVRKSQIASMNRMDRIRTFNYQQDRVTDHRIPVSTNGLDDILEGDTKNGGLQYLIDSLKDHYDNLMIDGLRKEIEEEIKQLASSLGK
ncbi:release factor [Meira miltonrushii]|uniref:Release factor n=1 Tax=Meira miltonrushii TaxID=1280837 RepID=A0A316VEF9_9BASI|nr:release factor [Meira miltonrushii]PWN34401.1 release factor [Meira miltonrushii]